jgi:uncharacterized protein
MFQLIPDQSATLRRPLARFVPDFYAASFADINFAALQQRGIDCIALDIDNTLIPHGGVELNEETITFFREQRDAGNIRRLAIATNRSRKRLGNLGEAMHADVRFHASGLRRKPLQSYFDALREQLDCEASAIAMVGDKIIQDVWGGNRAGLTTILVDPVGPALWFEKMLFRLARPDRHSM